MTSHNDGTTTVETNIVMLNSVHMLMQDSYRAFEESNDTRYLQYLSRVVVLIPKDDKRPRVFLMTIIGSKEYLEKHNFSLFDVSYKNIPEDFSGQLLYHTLAGDFVNGWQVDEGCQFKTCTLISEEEANLFEDVPDTRATVACKTITSYKYYYACRNGTGYEFRTYQYRPGSSFSCLGPFIKSEDYMVCSLLHNGNLPPTYSPGDIIPSYDLSILFSSYSPELYAQLQGFMNYMENYDNASRAVLSFIDYVKRESAGAFQKLNVNIDTTQTASVRYCDASNTVYFKSLDDYSDMELYEEVIHNLQRVVYSDYSNVSLNIEFEAKLIMDYVNFIDGRDGYTDMALNMKNAQAELSDGRLMTLSEWIRDNPYSSIDVEEYKKFLSIWKTIPDRYQNYVMSLRVHPKLLPSIINEINKNR